ncbi:MAG TPA: 1,4-alpha-glucan branching protein GlgB [Candidatus Paceibacterota bacterium]|nr:1,4-alpha-glucan branching protein GlgB [Verrucomicrobiota bacterium]HSA10912.1 1,4-alpha-glucan branching protein GlgB [Candidatus Paceibacterota bacterium]
MLLTQAELQSLIEVKQRTPHALLGMHPLGDGSGVVARALLPEAAKVEVQPVREKDKPTIKLTRLHRAGLFEGVTTEAKHVYSYELVITDQEGRVRRTRDPYSFLPTLGDADLYLFGKGDDRRAYEKLGAQLRSIDGVTGASFAVWAPKAQRVSVVGDFNHWDGRRHQMRPLGGAGVWEIFVPGVGEGMNYKYEVRQANGRVVLKTDPYGFYFETGPKTAARVWNNRKFGWTDAAWLKQRRQRDPLRAPLNIYEVHLGSWRKKTATESLGYRALANPLIRYVKQMGYTHVEFMPVAEHAYYPSWGYQVTGFYAPTSRYGTPEDLQFLINELHQAGVGVIIDWVPAHFPRDDWALARFDGTALYEHEDPRRGAHQDWGTLIFNYGRHEVVNFLLANALFWCDRFHVDGLRVDAVASMLYLDYSRKPGQWIPNQYGGRENLEAIEFIRRFNYLVHTEFPGVMTIAEESTAWPQVTRPPYVGGLGFTFKWNMGWMHDTLGYFSRDPVHRKYHQNDLTFAMLYHHHENFILPLSHDEVVHGKRSLLGRMPGDDWQKFANLRVLLGYQGLFPGKKLLFMGGEFGQRAEWDANAELDWRLLEAGPYHRGLQQFMEDLNRLYLAEPALWKSDYEQDGFRWIDCSDHMNSVLSFLRQDAEHFHELVVIANLTPVPRQQYRVGLPRAGKWRELLNSDAAVYGGSNMGNLGGVVAADRPWHGQKCSAEFVLPPLSILVFRPERVTDTTAADAQTAPEQEPVARPGAKAVANPTSVRSLASPHPGSFPQEEGTRQAAPRQSGSALLADRREKVLLLSKGEETVRSSEPRDKAPSPLRSAGAVQDAVAGGDAAGGRNDAGLGSGGLTDEARS